MADTHDHLTEFLTGAGWAKASRTSLAGDASARRYDRLRKDSGETAVLMMTGLTEAASLEPFQRIARHLDRNGLSAPRSIAEDPDHGFLLLEDFGDLIFARMMHDDPKTEAPLYNAAVDVLAHLHSVPAPAGVSTFTPTQMAEFAAIVFDWYVPGANARIEAKQAFTDELTRLLSLVETDRPVLALRDFHSENLVWLPDRNGIRRVGLLDFQDAFLCHPAYDLASLLRDARRDPKPALIQPLTDRYIRSSRAHPEDLNRAVAVYGAQRNLRILGVFARLCQLQGKPHYVGMMPRVWRHLSTDLSHPDLTTLRNIVLAALPEPTEDFRTRMKARCAAAPVP